MRKSILHSPDRYAAWLLWTITAVLFVLAAACAWGLISGAQWTKLDFSTLYVAGKLVDAGQVKGLYNLSAQALVHPDPEYQVVPLPFNHLAFESLLFAPLALLPYLAGYTVWDMFSVALLGWMTWRLRPHVQNIPGVSQPLLFMLSLAYFPNLITLFKGQDSILLTAIVTACYLQAKAGKDERAGMLLALGLFKFHLVLPVLACFCLNRQWRVLKGFAISAAGVAALSVAMVGTRGIQDYIELLRNLSRPPLSLYTRPELMPNLRGLLSLSLGAGSPLIPVAVLAFSLVFFLAVVRLLPGEKRGESFDLFFAAATILSYLVSFNTYEHDMALMFPGILLSFHVVMKTPSTVWKLGYCVLAAPLFIPSVYISLYASSRLSLLCVPTAALLWLLSFTPLQSAASPVDRG